MVCRLRPQPGNTDVPADGGRPLNAVLMSALLPCIESQAFYRSESVKLWTPDLCSLNSH